MKEDREEVDGKAAWRIAVAAVTILTISYGGPLISVVSSPAAVWAPLPLPTMSKP